LPKLRELKLKKILILASILASANALALNLQGYRFSDSYRYSILDDSLKDKFPGKYVATASLAYVKNPLYVTDKKVSKRYENIISYHEILTLGYSYYVNNDFSLGLDANYINNKVAGETHSDFADTIAKARWNLYRQNTFALSLNPQIFLPTGNKEAFTTTNSLGGSLSLVSEFASNRWHFLASLGYFSASGNEYSGIDYRNLLLSQFGVSYDLNDTWNMNLEAVNSYSTTQDHIQDEGDYYLTFKNKIKPQMSVNFGGGIAGVDEINRDNYTLFAGIKFHEAQ
jgi:hypothetical protein